MIVTRFAPSPTGYLHVGGARTALFNWLLARKAGGKFLLRIEDTDLKRNTPTAMKQVLADLRWLGIDWDEGPEVGGNNGPYLQSERRDIYDKYLQQLIDAGKAYYCFDTPEELSAMREQAEKEKRMNLYPRPATFPTAADVEKARAEGRPVTIRFAVTETEPIVVDDDVRGRVEFQPTEFSDFIICKSDGFPTYHFAVVVDDELMGVTNILRGQEHLMNTPLHQMLQKAMGFRIPQYAHLPIAVSEGGGKLSKRERPKVLRVALKAMADLNKGAVAAAGDISVEELDSFLNNESVPDMPAIDAMAKAVGVTLPEINVLDFLKSGYLPETLVNFLALLGWNPGDDREIMTTAELIEAFDMSRISKSNSLFDRQKLLSFNTEHIKITPIESTVKNFRVYLEDVNSPVVRADDETLAAIIKMNEGARTLEQIEQKTRFAYIENEAIEYDPQSVKKVFQKGNALEMLGLIAERFKTLDIVTPDTIETALHDLAAEQQVGLGKVAQPLRVALCGNTVSPSIADTVNMLGMKNTLKRIEITLGKFKTS